MSLVLLARVPCVFVHSYGTVAAVSVCGYSNIYLEVLSSGERMTVLHSCLDSTSS